MRFAPKGEGKKERKQGKEESGGNKRPTKEGIFYDRLV
jgi:hypothetical protein